MANGTFCPAWWSDRTDFLRYESFSCPVPIVVEAVLWSLVLVQSLRLLALHRLSWKDQTEVHRRNQQQLVSPNGGTCTSQWYKHSPLVLLLLSCSFIALTAFLAAIKVFVREYSTLGKDVLISLTFLYVSCVGFGTGLASELHEVRAVLVSLNIGKSEQARLYRQLKTPSKVCALMYMTTTISCTLSGFFVGGAVAPFDSPMRYVVLLRHVAVTALLFSGYRISAQLSKSTVELYSRLSSINSMTKGETNARLLNAVNKIAEMAKNKKLVFVVGGFFYSLFSIPFFWPYQSFLIAIFMLLSMNPKASIALKYRTNYEWKDKPRKIDATSLASSNRETSRAESSKVVPIGS